MRIQIKEEGVKGSSGGKNGGIDEGQPDYTLNLSFLNLYHVLYKQLQINIKYTFKLVFLLHVLILKAK
jgi:hypothetical protein